MVTIPSLSTLISTIENQPNAVLEKVIREEATGGIKRYGRRCPAGKKVVDFLRMVIMDRVRSGEYVYHSVTEKRKIFHGTGRYKALISDLLNTGLAS